MQTPKFLQNIKTRLFATSATTACAVGTTAYLTTIPQQLLTQNLESVVGTFLATILMATTPPLASAFVSIATNLISSDLYDRFTKKEFYEQIPPEANLYQATFLTFQSILSEVIKKEENQADQKQIKKLRDISLETWIELVSLDEQKDDISEVAKAILTKFNEEKITENQFLKGNSEVRQNLLSRQDWLVLLLKLQGEEENYLTSDLEKKIIDALEENYTARLRVVFSKHQETFQEVTLQLWETLFGKLDAIHEDVKDNKEISKETNQELKDLRKEFKEGLIEFKQTSETNIQQYAINYIASGSDCFIAFHRLRNKIDNKFKDQEHHFNSKDKHGIFDYFQFGNARYLMVFSKE